MNLQSLIANLKQIRHLRKQRRNYRKERRKLRREGEEAPCRYCGETLFPYAKRCQHCSSYQGFFRRNLHNWQLAGAIAFAVAFILVHGIDVARVAFRKPINLAVAWANSVDISGLEVAAKNIGRTEALIYQSSLLVVEYGDGERGVLLAHMIPWDGHDGSLAVDEVSGFHVSVSNDNHNRMKKMFNEAILAGQSPVCYVLILVRDMTDQEGGVSKI